MTPATYLLPDGAIPVLVSSDNPDLVSREAAAVLTYVADHPGVAPHQIADMLFRTRIARKHRALAMVTDRDGLISALRAIIAGSEHPSVVRTQCAAAPRRLAYVFPGQGGQRPGMGRLFYQTVPAFRAEVNRCAEAFQAQLGTSPLNYLLDEGLSVDDAAITLQPALFTQMAGLAAMWRSVGVAPNATIGHSQGEIAAAYVSGAITLADAVSIIGVRARAADGFAAGDYAMAVIAADRDACEDALARCSGWAQLSVINSPNLAGISGDRETVQAIVDTFSRRDTFARVIEVRFPAHTSAISALGDDFCAAIRRELRNPKFLDTDIDCLGATLGGPITQDLPLDQYWFWNLRNTVRFDKAIAAAVTRGIDTFVELAVHPSLQLAIEENLAAVSDDGDDRDPIVVGTCNRAATDLGDFTRNLAHAAVHDLTYPWDRLCVERDGPVALPLPDFPNTVMNETKLWLPYDEASSRRAAQTSTAATTPGPARNLTAPTATPRLLVENWVRLSQRSLVPPRSIGLVDHTGACAALAAGLCAAAADLGATARVIDDRNSSATTGLDTLVVLLPRSAKLDDGAAAAAVAAFFSDRTWWPGISEAITDCWLVTVGGEAVVADDPSPDPVHAAAISGFRSIGCEHPGVCFRYLDLPAESPFPDAPSTVLSALHTGQESAVALRDGVLYAKRIVESDASVADSSLTAPQHVLIIGGTGNLGLDFCEYLAHRGARRITLVSRSGETAAVANRLQQIRSATSARIEVAACDVGDPAAVVRLAKAAHDAPADLIVHAAVQYSGMELADITAEKAQQALCAKVVGISTILETFPRTADCRILLCSSVAATVGGRGLIVYAASNRMLDAMAHRLRSKGLDCVSVQWGQWHLASAAADTGMAKLAFTGLLPMSASEALALGMGRLRGNAIVAAFDAERATSVLQACGHGTLLSQLTSPVTVGNSAQDATATGAIRRLLSLLAGAIGVDDVEEIDTAVPMVALGLDSLQALELRRRVRAEFDHELEVSDLLGGASIDDVLAMLR